MKIWQKYLFTKLMKNFFFILFCLFAIFVVVDLSAHGVRFFSKANFREIALYYFHTFSAELDLFFSLTFLLASLRVLFSLVSHREIVALQMAGISKKKLLTPFFLFASCIALLGLMNNQWFIPHAGEGSSNFKTAYKAKKKSKEQKLYTISFDDESELVYRKIDRDKNELLDVFWIRNPYDIWHMKTFDITKLEGKFVNHLQRNQSHEFEKKESFPTKHFSELIWDAEKALKFTPYESRPLTRLFFQAFSRSADARIIFSHLYYKLLAPLIPFLILIAIGPIVIRYTRTTHTFFIASLSIFGLLALKTILDGMLILGENQVLPSYLAIFAPIAILLSATCPSFVRMQ